MIITEDRRMDHPNPLKAETLRNINKALIDGSYNNVSLICQGGAVVQSNALFLASISPWMCKLLKEHGDQEQYFLLLPDLNSCQVSGFLDTLYIKFLSKDLIETCVDLTVLVTLFIPHLSSFDDDSLPIVGLPQFDICPLSEKGKQLAEKYEQKREQEILENNLDVKDEGRIDFENLERIGKELFSDMKNSDKKEESLMNGVVDLPDDLYEEGLESFLSTIESEGNKIESEPTLNVTKISTSSTTEAAVKVKKKGQKYKRRKGKPKCDECGKELKSWRSLEMHKQVLHTENLERKFPCSFCTYSAKTLATLKTHEKYSHIEGARFHCDKCDYKASSKHNMSRHQKTHLVKKSFQCNMCDKLSVSYEGLKRHMKRNHNLPSDEDIDIKWVKPLIKLCPDCGKEFGNVTMKDRAKYNSHMLTHRLERFSCECEATWKSNYEKERHMKIVHMEFKECPHCHDAFKNESSVQKHIEYFHSESTENLVCHICGIPVKNIQVRQLHMRREHDTNVLRCTECGKDFQGKFRLDRHIGDVHKPPVQCPDCGEFFNNLRKHRRNVHMEDKDKTYQCDMCGKGFVYRRKLEFHKMSVHIKARPYACRFGCTVTGQGCNMSYNDESNRNAHEKKKHGSLFTKIAPVLVVTGVVEPMPIVQ